MCSRWPQELLSRVRATPPAATAARCRQTVARRRPGAVRDVAHGLLYLLPAAVFPVGISLLERDALVVGVLVVGAVGWIWSGASAWLAYQLLGHGLPGLRGPPVALVGARRHPDRRR